jgi:hypothetical protein
MWDGDKEMKFGLFSETKPAFLPLTPENVGTKKL